MKKHTTRKLSSRRRIRPWAWLAGSALLIGAGAGLYLLSGTGIAPRTLGRYLEHRSRGHNPVIETAGQTARAWLVGADRGEQVPNAIPWTGRIGMQADDAQLAPAGREVAVADGAALRNAIGAASPGQVITLQPGSYRIGTTLDATRPGTAEAPIVVRAARAGSVRLLFSTTEGFRVSAPYWRFENLTLTGVCASHGQCEHAFHVVGNARHFVARNNLIVDFNAHIKINGEEGRFPDSGLFESNTLRNQGVRQTGNPVTPIDMVAASHWVFRRNLIADFAKGEGDQISYGAFAKGGGENNLFEQNVVICEDRLRGGEGQRVGLSLGGGGTDRSNCRDGRCVTEQSGSTLRANLVASCADDGIYLNAAARSQVLHNTLVDTGGISVRFPESSADIRGNLVDGSIRSRDGAIVRQEDNLDTTAARLMLASHPVRALFRDPAALDFSWREPAARRARADDPVPDLCGGTRPALPRLGAFEDFKGCLKLR